MMQKLSVFSPMCVGMGHQSIHAFNLNDDELYKTYCSACHGAKGEGGVEGTAPPLVNSAWVKESLTGDQDRTPRGDGQNGCGR